ncbi:MAG: DUF4124 domain-containing protein [Xanthomonadales bacterium]|nr:DUF4124 domain-containing protein [Xanthomonadales bacterium]
MRRMLLAAALLAAALPVGAQQVYKWIDKDGTVHFTDSPPDESVNAERLVLRGATQSTLVDIQPRGMTREEVDLLYTPQQRQAACEQARANRTTLRNMTTVMLDKDGDGVPEELTAEEKAAELARAESQVNLLCREGDG